MTPYKNTAWYQLLADATGRMQKQQVASALGVSAPLLSQVMNGSGKYGTGEAGTTKLAERVLHTFGRYTCPHLSEQHGTPTEVSATQCRGHAHRPAPAGSPRDMQFWQACNACPHKAHSAPPLPREVKPRKGAAPLSTPSHTTPETL